MCAAAVSCDARGDINCDGTVDEADIDFFIQILFCDPCTECPNQDVNGDGLVSIADLIALIDFVVEGTPTPSGTPTATETPTPTLAPDRDCCDCPELEGLCAVPMDGACPDGCGETREAACLPGEGCMTFTPTPTLTPTLNPERDCCDCPELEGLCAVPMDGACPDGCGETREAACLPGEGCMTFTPTPTLTPTLAPERDCCDCPEIEGLCAVPMDGTCPDGCTEVREAVCILDEGCMTFTPTETPTQTQTPTVTQTPTPTLDPNRDCCACPELEALCADPMDGACPAGCTEVREAACMPGEGCVALTPTPTGTATSEPVPFTPTFTPRPPRTPTYTPMGIPFVC